MEEALIRNYNANVPEEAVCYFLGDMGFCGSEALRSVISRLNGTKILILGNHDKKQNSMYNAGFDAVLNSASMFIQGQLVTMSHCPLLGVYRENTEGMRNSDGTENWHGETNSKYSPYTIPDRGQIHLHGHIHSPNGGKSKKIEGRQMDIGVDANNYRPVHLSEVESFIAKYIENNP